VADLLKPVATQIAADVLSSKWVQSDDTGVDVQDRAATPQIRTGHVWTYRGAAGDAFYDCTWMRNSEVSPVTQFSPPVAIEISPPS
jgi:hypothetical protein